MNLSRHLRLAMIALSLSPMTGCYEPQGKQPEAPYASTPPDFSLEDVKRAVLVSDESISAPIAGTLPEACQRLSFRRFYPASQANSSPAAADAVVILMPGTLAAANSFTGMGEQLVFNAARQGTTLQVVAMNRRSQCLADLTGLNAAEATRDISRAADYYYHGARIDGKTFAGFAKGDDAAPLADFGIERAVRDMQSLAVALMPDQAMRQKKLFIGGHSLGANITTAFMGWDFDGDARTDEDAGYRQAAGFIRLDVSVTPANEASDPFMAYASKTTRIDATLPVARRYALDTWKMRVGLSPRYVTFPGVDPESLALLDMASMLAWWKPFDEHTLIRDLPLGATPELMLRLLHSKDINHFLSGKPGLKQYRFTNEALLGTILDDNFMPVRILQTSLGYLNGGRVTDKIFPNQPGLIKAVSALSPFIGYILTDGHLSIAGDAGPDIKHLGTGPLYGWTRFDQVGSDEYRSADGTTVLTRAETEVTDIHDFARIIHEGPQSFTEWYMPARLNTDFEALRQSAPLPTLDFWHYREARNAPLIDIVGDESIADVNTPPKGELIVAQGYNHLDIIAAANDRSTRRSNPVIAGMLDFINRHREP